MKTGETPLEPVYILGWPEEPQRTSVQKAQHTSYEEINIFSVTDITFPEPWGGLPCLTKAGKQGDTHPILHA